MKQKANLKKKKKNLLKRIIIVTVAENKDIVKIAVIKIINITKIKYVNIVTKKVMAKLVAIN